MSQAGKRGWGGGAFLHNQYPILHVVVHGVNPEVGAIFRPTLQPSTGHPTNTDAFSKETM